LAFILLPKVFCPIVSCRSLSCRSFLADRFLPIRLLLYKIQRDGNWVHKIGEIESGCRAVAVAVDRRFVVCGVAGAAGF
jgi:hypothetical protein